MKKILFVLSLVLAVAAFLFIEKSSRFTTDREENEEFESVVGDRDNPDAAFRFRYGMLAGSEKGIDLQQYRRDAVSATNKMAVASKTLSKTTGVTWTELGPGNIGGRVRSVVVNPANSTQLLAGSVSGGIWKSTDGGASWKPRTDSLDFLAISSMVLDPTNSNVVYAGTGEGWLNLDAVYGGGIYKSTNFGDSWTLLTSTSGASGANYRDVVKIAADPQGNIYAATKDYQAKYGTGEYTTAGGLYKSTNAGTSWTKISSTDAATGYYNPSDVIPVSSSIIVYAEGGGSGIYRTTNGGTNWSQVSSNLPTTNFGRVALAQDPSNANTVYAAIESYDVTSAGDGGLKGIYKSTDAGATWTQLTTPSKTPDTGNLSYLGAQGWYDNVISVDPNNSNNIYVGGIDVMKSTDGGSTWAMAAFAYSSSPRTHPDHHALVFDKNNPGTVYDGSDGGVYRTTNGSTSWISLNNGLAITQFYGGAVYRTGATYFGGTQDNGHLKYGGAGSTWTLSAGGDGGYAAQDQTNPLVSYEEYVYLAMSKTTDGGASWHSCVTGLTDAGNSTLSLFIAPFAMNPLNSSMLIAASNKVWVTTNSAGSWTLVSNVLPGSSNSISAITVTGAGAPYVGFAGTSDGRIYRCTTLDPSIGVNQWDPVTPTGAAASWVRRIVIDPNDNTRILATYGGYNTTGTLASRHVWLSTDQGTTWLDISRKLPNVPVHTLIIDPNTSSTLFVGTETGIYSSTNTGSSWSIATAGMPWYAPTDELVIQKDTKAFFAFTHGRGVFSTGASSVASPGWTIQSTGITTALTSVKAISSTVAWAAGYSSQALRTTNGGTSWSPVGGASIGGDIYAIDALDANTAFVTTTPSTSTFIYRTTDGGGTWTNVYTLSGGFIDGIKMFDATNGIAIGDPVGGKWTIAKTSDGGATWNRTFTQPNQSGSEAGWNNSVAIYGSSNVWFGTSSYRVFRSTNGGTSWSSSPVPFQNSVSVTFSNNLYGLAGSDSGMTARTTDGGVTWNAVSVGGAGSVFGLSAVGDDFFAAEGSTVYRSTDLGSSWASSFTGSIGALNHLNFVGSGASLLGYAVSGSGTIAAFAGTATGAVEKNNPIPSSFVLAQNYPNPFNPQTRIEFALPKAAHVSLTIFNSVGEEVATLVDNVMSAGTHDVDWNGKNRFSASVASGVYFYRVVAGEFVQTKKMLLVK